MISEGLLAGHDLMTRRSVKPRNLEGPDFSEGEIRALIDAAIRVPDHSRLSPWRFFLIHPEEQVAFNHMLADRLRVVKPDRPEESYLAWRDEKIVPLVVVVGGKYDPDHHKVPVWEQKMSCGAACMNLLHAAHALGLGGQWISDWACEDEVVRSWFECDDLIGIIYLGRPAEPAPERGRAVFEDVAVRWMPPETPSSHPHV